MKGDFSRVTFDPAKHFSRVLKQQGRLELDADWNEQVDIFWHYLRTLGRDLIGPHGGPGFEIIGSSDEAPEGLRVQAGDFAIGPGNYYVEGILCENPSYVLYSNQPDYPLANEDTTLSEGPHFVYLDVWERHITHIEDESIREVALGGPDTATRAKVVWQVRVESPPPSHSPVSWLDSLCRNRGQLEARAKGTVEDQLTEPCIASPDARYRGVENQLYRVEIHQGGSVGSGAGATFKWSRENGSVAFPIVELSSGVATLEYLSEDESFGLQVGDWVEVVDDHKLLRAEPGELFQVEKIEREAREVTLGGRGELTLPVYDQEDERCPLLRRWDHQPKDPKTGAGAVRLEEGQWLDLEDGVEIRFDRDDATYRTGDYWLIPARTATGDVDVDPDSVQPHGIVHHYAPLAILVEQRAQDHRNSFEPLGRRPR